MPVFRAALAAIVFTAARAVAQDLSSPSGLPLPKCGDANNCFECFLQEECVDNPLGGDPICTPCGWCASPQNYTWMRDSRGSCVFAPIGAVDFCQMVDPGAERYCPASVCKVGDWSCNCKANVCPMVENLIGIFTVEGLWAIMVSVFSIGMCLLGACCWSVCRRSPPQRIIIVPYDPAVHGSNPVNLNTVTEGDQTQYARMA
mmetsp:Transcript_25156/g.50417  ORF Transcript_25156/g.50417 Transcript_25156/m.50417 type:complete len:202 (-) Transcript_25156:461-1066(-)